MDKRDVKIVVLETAHDIVNGKVSIIDATDRIMKAIDEVVAIPTIPKIKPLTMTEDDSFGCEKGKFKGYDGLMATGFYLDEKNGKFSSRAVLNYGNYTITDLAVNTTKELALKAINDHRAEFRLKDFEI